MEVKQENSMCNTKLHTTEAFHNRKNQIENCLYKKLLTVPYSAISVSDLCSDVGISRRAFYHYFEDKDDCLCGLVDRFFRAYMLEVTAIPKDISDREKALALVKIWHGGEGSRFFDIFERNQLLNLLMMRAIRFAKEEERSFAAPFAKTMIELDEDILCCYLATDMALIMRWHYRGYDSSMEEMAEKYMRCIDKFQ